MNFILAALIAIVLPTVAEAERRPNIVLIMADDLGYTTDLLTKYATDFISRNRDKPFFLYLAHAAPLPEQEVHGRSFAPLLLGKPGNPWEWIHIQHEAARQVRNSDYMLDNKDQFRRVVELWQESAKANENKDPEKQAAACKSLRAVFDALGK